MKNPDGQFDQAAIAALDVGNVTKVFRPSRLKFVGGRGRGARVPHTAVDDVSFRVAPGEIYGVIGANGSGKSTLIRILSTLLLPDSGDVRIFGHDVLRNPQAVRPLLNRVSADPSFFRAMSALENLLFFGRAYGLSGAETRRRSADHPAAFAPGGGSRPPAHAPPLPGPAAEGGGRPSLSQRPPSHAARRAHHRA